MRIPAVIPKPCPFATPPVPRGRRRPACGRPSEANIHRRPARIVAATLLISLLGLGMPGHAAQRFPFPLYPEFAFSFALIGDTPYNAEQETNAFPNVIEEINRDRSLAFVVHDGDIKAGATPCSTELLDRRLRQFQTFRHPLIYLPGDNEWSDCGKSGSSPDQRSPEDWLNELRARFSAGDRSLGQRTLYLDRQSRRPEFAAYRENVRWIHGGVIFAGLNVPGDLNNFGKPEFAARNAANLAWLNDAFDVAERQKLRAILIVFQANPHFDLPPTNSVRRGFNDLLRTLEDRTVRFRQPVVLVHGDSHYFRIDQPLVSRRSGRRVENFTRVETYGNPDVHWVKATVNWSHPEVFSFERRLVRKNFIRHEK